MIFQKSSSFKACALISLTLLVGACSKSSDSAPPSQSTAVPKSLSFTKPTPGSELTKEQVQTIRQEFGPKAHMVLPPADLVFPQKDTSAAELARREQELKAIDANSYDLLMLARSGCAKGHPTLKVDATFPMDQATEENLLVGDKLAYSTTAGLTGANCPVELSGGLSFNAEVTEKNSETKEIAGQAGYGSRVRAIMKNEKFAKLLGARGFVGDFNLSGVAVRRDIVTDKQDRILVNLKISGSLLSLKSDIPFQASVQSLIEKDLSAKTNTSEETIVDMKIQMPTFTAHVVVHQVTKADSEKTTEIYINGNPKTEQEAKDLFGQGPDSPIDAPIGLANSLK